MARRNDPPSPSARNDAPGQRPAGGPWSADRPVAAPLPAAGPWSRWNRRAATASGATLATPLTWMGGSLLLTCTVFLVSIIALIRSIVALVD